MSNFNDSFLLLKCFYSGEPSAAVFTYKTKRNDVGIKIKSATAMSGNN